MIHLGFMVWDCVAQVGVGFLLIGFVVGIGLVVWCLLAFCRFDLR